MIVWTYLKALNKKPHRQHLLTPISIKYFGREVVELYFDGEVEVRAYNSRLCELRIDYLIEDG